MYAIIMNMVVLALLAISLAGIPQKTETDVPPSVLERLVGKPTSDLQGPEAAPLCPGSGNNFTFPAPWYVWRTTRQNRFVVFCLARLITARGGEASIQLFDATGKRLAASKFRTGNRERPESAALVYSDSSGTELIVFKTRSTVDSQGAREQYFALSADRLRFVRAESESGETVYSWPLETMGFMPEAKTPDEWIALLQSTNRADVISALVFIGGEHVDNATTDPALIKMVREIRQDTRVRALIQRLRESDNEWIRQAAQLAARQ